MRQIQVIATTVKAYDLDRNHWHQPGHDVERTRHYVRITGAQIKHDEPVCEVTVTDIGRSIVVTIEPANPAPAGA